MIKLFHIPDYNIDTSKFSSLLHDKIVTEFEENFAKYVGAKYAVSLNSATNAIYLICKSILWAGINPNAVDLPTMIPTVVCNAIINSGMSLKFVDYTKWVGRDFELTNLNGIRIIDSAHKVDHNQFDNYNNNDLVYFSFYPTKVCSGSDGGMICGNNKDRIDFLRTLTFNGMSQEPNNWERKQTMIGYKMYMNSLQAYIANENLKKLDKKKEALKIIRCIYNAEFGLNNTSEHLYRINVEDRDKFMQRAKGQDIVCGIHYECAHLNPIFKQTHLSLPNSESESRTTVSIPYHEALSERDIERVIKLVNG